MVNGFYGLDAYKKRNTFNPWTEKEKMEEDSDDDVNYGNDDAGYDLDPDNDDE